MEGVGTEGRADVMKEKEDITRRGISEKKMFKKLEGRGVREGKDGIKEGLIKEEKSGKRREIGRKGKK